MMFSPNHQILRADLRADLYFGEHEVLLAAKHLVGRPGITRALPKAGIAYVHFMFERHEVVLANGVWSESFQPGDQSLAGLDDDQRAELLTLFPALATQHGIAHYPAARRHPAPLRGPRPAGLKRGGAHAASTGGRAVLHLAAWRCVFCLSNETERVEDQTDE